MKRWLIRSFITSLLLLGLGGWLWNCFYSNMLFYEPHGSSELIVFYSIHGEVYVRWGGQIPPSDILSFYNGLDDPKSMDWVQNPMLGVHYFLGFFVWQRDEGWPNGILRFVGVPYWFLTIVFALTTIYVWKKTRKPNPATAFPVEIDKLKT